MAKIKFNFECCYLVYLYLQVGSKKDNSPRINKINKQGRAKFGAADKEYNCFYLCPNNKI